MASELSVVGLDVQVDRLEESMLPQETQHGGCVVVVLVLHRLARLGLDHDLPGEPNLLLVCHGHLEHLSVMRHFTMHVRVEDALITLSPSPEHEALAAELVRDIDGLLHLSSSPGEDLRIGVGGASACVARVRKEVGSAPQQLDPSGLLQLEHQVRDFVKVLVRLRQSGTFGGHVHVMEGVVLHSKLRKELERRAHATKCVVERVRAIVPVPLDRGFAKRIKAVGPERVPKANAEAEPVLHFFAQDLFFCVVVAKGE
mmetsp:Transcript_25365/g.71735  ORF Transcript_25365/g.71735 Transcript_25365/m.71735 type:complete len:257 (+) Transcript_25365:820-1590(+)